MESKLLIINFGGVRLAPSEGQKENKRGVACRISIGFSLVFETRSVSSPFARYLLSVRLAGSFGQDKFVMRQSMRPGECDV